VYFYFKIALNQKAKRKDKSSNSPEKMSSNRSALEMNA